MEEWFTEKILTCWKLLDFRKTWLDSRFQWLRHQQTFVQTANTDVEQICIFKKIDYSTNI